ncbi:hypothetical protein, partial [Salmonella enterica]|uniref:hypothetical protein n=1 Tax=Salmonella enterica TaxID=28901 RepID=UPI001C608E4C
MTDTADMAVVILFRGEPLPNVHRYATFDGFDTSDRSKTHKTEAQLSPTAQTTKRSGHHPLAPRLLESQCRTQSRLPRSKRVPKTGELLDFNLPNRP